MFDPITESKIWNIVKPLNINTQDEEYLVSSIERLLEREVTEAVQEAEDKLISNLDHERGTRITKREREIFDYVTKITKDTGKSPTMREIAEHFGLAISTVSLHLKRMREKLTERLV